MANDDLKNVDLTSMRVSPDSFEITPGAGALTTPVRAIRCEGAGTLTVTTAKGSSRTMYFKDGETRFVACTHVTAASGVTFIEGMP